MTSIKIKRISSQIAKEVSDILANDSSDDTFKSVTITGADVTNDLSFAKIYFTTIDNKETMLKDLKEASSFIRKEIAQRLDLRHTPEISFHYDESIEYGNNIERIIKNLHEEKDEL